MTSLMTPIFVGRRKELEELDAALAAVNDGSGRCVLIRGEAGVGKSRLIAEVRARATDRGFTELIGRCFDQDRSFPYAPLIDMLRSLVAGDKAADLLAELGPLAQPLATLIPELAPHLVGPPLPPPLEGEGERRRLFAALTALLLRQAEHGPLLVVIEDLHWSDEAALAFLLYLVRRMAGHPLLLVLSARPEDGPTALTTLLVGLDREPVATEMSLEPLTRPEVTQLLQALLDQAEAPSAAFVDAIYTLSEGNPFFTEEICTSLIASGDVYYEKDQWRRKPLSQIEMPDSLLRMVQQRLVRLSEPARRLIDLAAVSGRTFDFAVLQALTGQRETELLALVKELLAAHILVEESADQFTFRHALTREALYGRLLARERQILHAQLVQAIEDVHAGALEPHLEALSYHAFAGALWPKALAYGQQAGEKALALYAPQAAVAHFTRALDAAARGDIRPPVMLYRQRGEAFDILGDFDRARADYEQELDAARERGDEKATWRALLDLGLLWAARDYERAGRYCREALAVARKMEDTAAVAHSLNRLGNWMMNSGQPEAALDYHREALQLFEEMGAQAGIATTLDLLAMTSNQCGDAVATVAYYERAIPILRALNDRQTLSSSLTMLSVYKLDEALGREAVALAREIEWRSGEAYALSYLGSLLAYRGDLGEGLRVAASGRALAEEIDHRLWLSWSEIVLGLIYLELLAVDEARRHLRSARELALEVGSTFMINFASGLLASADLMLGRREEATALLPAQMTGKVSGGEYTLAKALVERALADDDPLLALQQLDQLTLPTRPHWLGGMTTFYGALVELRGECLRRLNRLDEAEAELQAMLALYQEQGTRMGLWRLYLGLGKVYQDQGDVARMQASLAATRERIAALADTVPDETLREHFRRRALAQIPPVQPLTPRQAKKAKYGGLTRREREVAAIVAQGLTNQEIADDLVVSVKTVEAHITRILSKLGFSSRAQVAAWAVDKGLASAPQDLDTLARRDEAGPGEPAL